VRHNLIIAARMTVLTILATGLIYPLAVWGTARLAFPSASAGSLVTRDGVVVGSALIGQRFESARYFHGRPSAAGEDGYDAGASSASNLAPTSRALFERVSDQVDDIIAAEGVARGTVPVDLVTASGSGLDPDISPDSAHLQVARVARVRDLEPSEIARLVDSHIKRPQLGVLGEARVNVLELNLALDRLSSQ